MSIMTIPMIMDRIKGASQSSQIAVFNCHRAGEDDEVFANAVFADTVVSKQWIRDKSHGFVGVFDGSMDRATVKQAIYSAVDRGTK